MTHTDLTLGHISSADDILRALIEAAKNGESEIRIRVGRDRFRIFEVPDKNELAILSDIVAEYEQLNGAGNKLTLDGDQHKAMEFAKQLVEISKWAKVTDTPCHKKNKTDVYNELLLPSLQDWNTIENELLLPVVRVWKDIRKDSSNKKSTVFSLPRYDKNIMRQVFHNSVRGHLIDASTPEEVFLYLFGVEKTCTKSTQKIMWLGMIPDLVTFIDFLVSDYYWASKTASNFLVYSQKDNTFHPVTSRTLSTSFNREAGRDYKDGKNRPDIISNCIFATEGNN